jgi:TIR domain
MADPATVAPKHTVFVSYRHGEPWVAMTAKFAIKLRIYRDAWHVEPFVDSQDIVAGDRWRDSIDTALAGCSGFLCLLCDEYWESAECRREFDAVLARRQQGDPVRVFVVLAEAMKPAYLKFRPDGSRVGDVAAVGDFHFLGPYDDAQKLVPMNEIPAQLWGKQAEAMLGRLHAALG